jgi:hypothetical protein
VLDWIDVAIFDVARVVVFVADQVFPKAALPDAAFSAALSNRVQTLLRSDGA